MSARVVPLPLPPALPVGRQRPPLRGGSYDPPQALDLMNSWFMVSERDGEAGIFRVEDDGTLTYLNIDSFRLLLANLSVLLPSANPQSSGKLVSIDGFWLRHPQRRWCSRIVFDPSNTIGADEYNLWRGFPVSPVPGFQKQRRLLQHIFRIVCRRDKKKFKYLMKWLAWAVQNPHRPAEVLVVLQSSAEGSGKSSLGNVMLQIFGQAHGLLVDDKEQLLGTFNSHLETTCFVLGEEVLWAGDHKTADALKSRVTASVIPIEAKYRARRQVPNRLHVMLTTNHAWAVPAGVQARRYFVVDVSDEVAQDSNWFGPLYADLNAGGTAEFLHLLLNLQLGDWHPRQVPKTEELIDQQVMSAGSIEQWLLACTEIDAVAGIDTILGNDIATSALYRAYVEHTRSRSQRPETLTMFGKLLTKLFGPSKRLPGAQSSTRAPSYSIPGADGIRGAVLKHLKADRPG